MDQQKLFWKLESLRINDLLIFPSSRSSPRIDVRRTIVGTELGWMVTIDGKSFTAKNAQKVVDYLLAIRPISELANSTKIRVDEVDMGEELSF